MTLKSEPLPDATPVVCRFFKVMPEHKGSAMNRVKLNGFPNFCRKMIACSGRGAVHGKLIASTRSGWFPPYSTPGSSRVELRSQFKSGVIPRSDAVRSLVNAATMRSFIPFRPHHQPVPEAVVLSISYPRNRAVGEDARLEHYVSDNRNSWNPRTSNWLRLRRGDPPFGNPLRSSAIHFLTSVPSLNCFGRNSANEGWEWNSSV